MAVAANADDYTKGRVNIFFPANNSTPDDGNLTGQCVTLVKWFMAEMANVPNPFAARGDARYVGDALVNQGLAVAIPAGQQRRGDIVVWKYGTYGHIAVMLSGGRIFQENAQVAGAARRVLSDGTVVWSSTIMAMFPSLGGVAPSFYRLNSYNEPEEDIVKPSQADVYSAFRQFCLREPDSQAQVEYYMGRDIRDLYHDIMFYEIIPKPAVVEQAFKDLQPWSPINTPPYTDQTAYYSNKPGKVLFSDLAFGLKNKLAESVQPAPTPLPADSFVEYNGDKLYIKKGK